MARVKYAKGWDKEQDKRLIQMVKDGVSREEIAEQLGRTESAIQSRVSQIRIIEPLPILRSRRNRSDCGLVPQADDFLTQIRDILLDIKVSLDTLNAELLK